MLEPPLTADEARVLACLVENAAISPDADPRTANALRDATNQSTSRDPVMTLTGYDDERTVDSLKERGRSRRPARSRQRQTRADQVRAMSGGSNS